MSLSKKFFKFRRGSLTDVLWLMFTLLIFVVVTRMQLEFSSIETIDSYAKNAVSSEFNTYVSKISGFSTKADKTKIFANNGEARKYSSFGASEYNKSLAREYNTMTSFSDNTSSVVALIQKSEDELKTKLLDIFKDKDSSWAYKIRSSSDKTKQMDENDISIEYEETTNSTKVILTVKFKINITTYKDGSGGSFDKDSDVYVDRKITLVRTIENPSRFK